MVVDLKFNVKLILKKYRSAIEKIDNTKNNGLKIIIKTL